MIHGTLFQGVSKGLVTTDPEGAPEVSKSPENATEEFTSQCNNFAKYNSIKESQLVTVKKVIQAQRQFPKKTLSFGDLTGFCSIG